MKTKYCLSFIAALLLQFTTVKADIYTDGVTKLFESEILSSFGIENSGGLTHNSEATGKEVADKMKPVIVEWATPCYRQNMSEKEFTQMIDYVTRPEYIALQKKVMGSAKSNSINIQQMIDPSVMQTIAMGGTPENLKLPDCDPQLLKEIQHTIEIECVSEISCSALSVVKDMILKQFADKMPAEQKEQMTTMMGNMFNYIDKNMDTILITELAHVVTLEDLKAFNAIENEPFFPSYNKAQKAMAKNVKPLIEKMMQLAMPGADK